MTGNESYPKCHMLMGILRGILIGLAFLLSPIMIGLISFFIGIKKLRDGPRKKDKDLRTRKNPAKESF